MDLLTCIVHSIRRSQDLGIVLERLRHAMKLVERYMYMHTLVLY